MVVTPRISTMLGLENLQMETRTKLEARVKGQIEKERKENAGRAKLLEKQAKAQRKDAARAAEMKSAMEEFDNTTRMIMDPKGVSVGLNLIIISLFN